MFLSPPRPSPLTGISITRIIKQGVKCEVYLHHLGITAPSTHLTLALILPEPCCRGRGGGDRDELLHQPLQPIGVFLLWKRAFFPLLLTRFFFLSSFLAFHLPCSCNLTLLFLLSNTKPAASTPPLAKEEQKLGKTASSRYYFEAGFPAVVTGRCSARDLQSPTLKSEESSRSTPLGSATGRAGGSGQGREHRVPGAAPEPPLRYWSNTPVPPAGDNTSSF